MQALAHLAEQPQILGHGAVPVGGVPAGLRESASELPHLLRGGAVHVRESCLDELHGALVYLVEVPAGRPDLRGEGRLPDEPAHVGYDAGDVEGGLLEGVGVVHADVGADVAGAVELLVEAKVHAYALGMAKVQVPVRLGRKPSHDGLLPPFPHVLGHYLRDEVLRVRQAGCAAGRRRWRGRRRRRGGAWRRRRRGGRRRRNQGVCERYHAEQHQGRRERGNGSIAREKDSHCGERLGGKADVVPSGLDRDVGLEEGNPKRWKGGWKRGMKVEE
mmetsp:Transcript_18734/g.38372  ORF Transcript_18734/g.38372 Transcript_18734/m.38372 type:complete len:274 (+) Transcript_18734:1292-2113(+)